MLLIGVASSGGGFCTALDDVDHVIVADGASGEAAWSWGHGLGAAAGCWNLVVDVGHLVGELGYGFSGCCSGGAEYPLASLVDERSRFECSEQLGVVQRRVKGHAFVRYILHGFV